LSHLSHREFFIWKRERERDWGERKDRFGPKLEISNLERERRRDRER
jgi:hypothetical protein